MICLRCNRPVEGAGNQAVVDLLQQILHAVTEGWVDDTSIINILQQILNKTGAGGAVDNEAVIDVLQQILFEVREPWHGPVVANPEWGVRQVLVSTAGTPVRGPDVTVDRRYAVVIRQRVHAGAPTGYIAPTQGDVLNTATRIETADGDSFNLRISNMNRVWFDSSANSTSFEMLVEK